MSEINQIFDANESKKILEVDAALTKTDNTLLKFSEDINKLVSILKDQNISFEKLTQVQKQVVDNSTKLDAVGKQLLQSEEKLKQVEDNRTALIIKNRIETQKATQTIKDKIKANDAEEGSLIRMRLRLKELTEAYDKAGVRTEEAAKEINDLSKEIQKAEEATNRHQRGVGNYEESIRNALEPMKQFSGNAGDILNNFTSISQQEGGVNNFFKTTVTGITSATKAGLKFIATPIGAIIAAIVVGITLFTAAIKRNQDASDGFAKIWAGFKNVIQEVIGRIFLFLGAIGKIFQGRFNEAFDDLKKSVTGFGKALSDANKEGQKLYQMQVDLEKSTINLITAQEKLNGEIEKYNIIADDNTRSFKERTNASQTAMKLEEERAKNNLSLIQQELDIVNLRVEQAQRQGRINRDLLKEQAEANAKLIGAENEYTAVIFNNAKQRNELKQDMLEKDLDILIDGFDNQKTINERIIANDRYTTEERQKLLNQTIKLGEDSFNKQGETIQKFTQKQIDYNDLLATSDAVVLNEKIRSLGLSEIIEGRLLEIIRERRTAIQDLNDAQQTLDEEEIKSKNEIAKKYADYYKDLLEKDKEYKDKKDAINKLIVEAAIQDRQRQYEQELLLIDASTNSETEKRKNVFDLNKRYIAEDIALLKTQLDNTELSTEKRIELSNELKDLELENQQLIADDDKRKHDEKLARQKELADGLIQLGSKIFEFSIANTNAELTALEEKNKKGLISEENFNKQKAALDLKKAKQERNKALFEIAINTASAIVEALPNVALAAIAGVIGAISAATVLAEPLPRYWTGKKNTPSDFIAGDKPGGGSLRELVELKTGELLMANKETRFKGDRFKGATVYSNKDTERIINTSHSGFGAISFSDSRIVDELADVKKAIINKPVGIFQDGKIVGYKTNNYRETYINRLKHG